MHPVEKFRCVSFLFNLTYTCDCRDPKYSVSPSPKDFTSATLYGRPSLVSLYSRVATLCRAISWSMSKSPNMIHCKSNLLTLCPVGRLERNQLCAATPEHRTIVLSGFSPQHTGPTCVPT